MKCSIVVIIDQSASMRGKRMEAATADAAGFINVMGDDDKLGVVAYATKPTTVWPGETATSVAPILPFGTRKPITDKIEDLDALTRRLAQTNMVAAFTLAQRLLAGTPGRLGEVFLSDGEFNDGGDPVPWLVDNQPNPRIPIHTIALGYGGQETTLQGIAGKTGGGYHFVEDSYDLARIYNIIAGEMSVARLIATSRSALGSNGSLRTEFIVPAGTADALFSINWDNWAVAVTSDIPHSNELQVSIRDSKAQILRALPVETGKGFAVFKVLNPVPGTYTVSLWYVGTGSLGVTVGAFDNSSITAAIAAPQNPVPAGSPATVDFHLADDGDPIDDARVEVTLDSPLVTLAEAAETHAERLKAVTVQDEDIPEEHQTAAKLAALQEQTGERLLPRERQQMTAQPMGGGLYRVEIPNLPKAGSHTVRVYASGTSPRSKTPFQRTAEVSFIVAES
jgi:hypothetical protein